MTLAVLATAWQPGKQPPDIAASSRVWVQGWVASRPQHNAQTGSHRCLLRLEALRLAEDDRLVDLPATSHLLLRCRLPLPAFGSRLECEANYEAPRPGRHFHGMQETAFLKARDAWGTLYAKDFRLLPGARGAAWRRQIIEPWRTHLLEHIRQTLDGLPRGLLLALVLGIRSDLDTRLGDAWRALGMSHVLALSGMHVGVVAAGLLLLVGSVRRGRGLCLLLTGVFVYAAVGGLSASVLRASFMVACASVATFLGRMRQPIRALSTVALWMLAATPARLHDLGFQLSCVATFGILLVAGPMARWALQQQQRSGPRRLLAWLIPAAGVGLAAQLMTLPWILHHFGYVSWMSPLANLILVPIVDVALVLGLSGAAVSLFLPDVARLAWLLAGTLLQGVAWLSLQIVAWCDPRVFLRSPVSVLVCASLAAASFVGLMLLRGRWRLLLLVGGGLALTGTFVLGGRSSRAAWQYDMLDIGQGDATLLRLGTEHWLIDAGPQRPIDQGERTIVPYLQREGMERLRGLVVSHPHLDHYGGVGAVLAQVRVDTLYVAMASWEHPVYARWRRQHPDVPQRGLQLGDRIDLSSSTEAIVLWPPAEDVLRSGANGVSVSLWVRAQTGPAILCMGDLEQDGEQAVLEVWGDSLRAARVDFLVLKAAHHGSETSSSAAFLDAIDPEVALISSGKRNRYGHPSPRTLAALQRRHCIILRTDEGGDIRLQRRGTALWVQRPASPLRILASPEPGIDGLPTP